MLSMNGMLAQLWQDLNRQPVPEIYQHSPPVAIHRGCSPRCNTAALPEPDR